MAAIMHILMLCIVVVIDFVALLIAAITGFAVLCIVAVILFVMLCVTVNTDLSCCELLQS